MKMLNKLPRVSLANLPTPLHEAKNLSKHLGGPKILFKRDDATGLVLGGQKTRMFEYPLGDAVARGYDVILTYGSEDANFSSQLVACANKIGMDIVMVFYKRKHPELAANALLTNLLDPVAIDTDFAYGDKAFTNEDEVIKEIDKIAEDLRSKNRKPYVTTLKSKEPYKPLCVVSFFYCFQEIIQQLKEIERSARSIYVAHASGSVQGGLVLGGKYFDTPIEVVGVLTIPGHSKKRNMAEISEKVNQASEILGAGIAVTPDDFVIKEEYIGPERLGAFSKATEKGIDTIRLVAKTEGIFLDPHYTGKAMAALIDDIKSGKFTAEDTVIFYLTGGAPNIFSYAKELKIENKNYY